MMWTGRSAAWRAGAVAAAVGLGALGWWLGSPLFIRTTLVEALPSPTVAASAPAASSPATGATAAPAASAPAAPGPTILSQGELGFVDDLHYGKGPVRVLRVGEQRIVRFEGVTISNAPDIHIYLSREIGGKWSDATSLYLGALKATNGSFNYEIPASADLSQYRSVVVWCRAFAVLITWADLKPA